VNDKASGTQEISPEAVNSAAALAEAAESIEAELMYLGEKSAPAEAASALGIAVTRLRDGVVVSMRNDPAAYWSAALGFGFAEPVTEELIDEIVDFYRGNGDTYASIKLAPSVLPPDWERICAKHGLRAATSRTCKLAAPLDEVSAQLRAQAEVEGREPHESKLRVARVPEEELEAWAEMLVRAFAMPDPGGHLAAMIAAFGRDPAARPFGVWDGPDLVAGANLLVHGTVASLNTGATLPSHRELGAQSALIAARVHAAAEARCRLIVSEAGEPAAGATNPSLSNLQRAGLKLLYPRQGWRWEASTDPTMS
jgi:hypothetical protein